MGDGETGRTRPVGRTTRRERRKTALIEQGRLLNQGKLPILPLASVQWYIDYVLLGEPPAPLWALPSTVADEVRFLLQHVELPEPGEKTT